MHVTNFRNWNLLRKLSAKEKMHITHIYNNWFLLQFYTFIPQTLRVFLTKKKKYLHFWRKQFYCIPCNFAHSSDHAFRCMNGSFEGQTNRIFTRNWVPRGGIVQTANDSIFFCSCGQFEWHESESRGINWSMEIYKSRRPPQTHRAYFGPGDR